MAGRRQEAVFRGSGRKVISVAAKARLPSGPGSKASFESGVPGMLFDVHLPAQGRTTVFEYDVTADGKRFLLDAQAGGAASAPPLFVVVNWDAVAKR
jgi:hypothetical protein